LGPIMAPEPWSSNAEGGRVWRRAPERSEGEPLSLI
jgi:hypothetical protein